MKKVMFGISLAFLTVLLISSVLAVPVTVEAERFKNVIIRVYNSDSGAGIDNLYGQTNMTGQLTKELATSSAIVDFLVLIVQNGQVQDQKEFKGISTSSPIFLQMLEESEQQAPVVEELNSNVTLNETEQTQEATTEQESEQQETSEATITGNVISESKGIGKLTYYIIAAVILFGGLLLIIFRKMNSTPKEPSPPKQEKQVMAKPRPMDLEEEMRRELIDAENKLKEAQAEINNLKRAQQVKEAEKRYQQAKDELDKLRGN